MKTLLSEPDTIVRALTDPGHQAQMSEADWSALVPVLRHRGLLGELAARLSDASIAVPALINDQLEATRRIIDRQKVVICNEIRQLEAVLESHLSKPVLLKGAAYLALGLPNARARFSSDVDLMVSRSELDLAERLLRDAGWAPANRSSYDDHYYRDWMHEVPPMRHIERGTFVDLHHAITPPVSRLAIPTESLMSRARPIPGSAFFALAPPDMVLHSACHVLSDGDFSFALRDFLDLQKLMNHFGLAEPNFWTDLQARSAELGIRRTLFYAVALLTGHPFHLDIPEPVRSEILSWGPPPVLARPVRTVMARTVLPAVSSGMVDRLANQLMIARSHYLRMPLTLLIPHLARKSVHRLRRSFGW